MRGCLVQIDALDPETNERQTIRAGASGNPSTLRADGLAWLSAVSTPPKISLDFFDIDYKGTVQTGKAQLELNSKRLWGMSRDYLTTLIWEGSPITIWSGEGTKTADMFVEFVGLITSGVIDRSTGKLSLQCEVNKKIIDVPMLNVDFGGGGGYDGDPEVIGQLRPACFGKPINVPVFFFDQTNWIGQVDGYGNCISIDTLYEDAASFGDKAANYANYGALLAAVVAEGEWATCVAQGLIRLGANPQGVITTDPVCGYGTPGAMMQRWLTTHAGISAGYIDADSFSDLDDQLTDLLGHAPAASYYVQDQVQVLERVQTMCAACNATPFQGPDGKISVSRAIGTADPLLVLERIGGRPLVTDWRSLDAPEPWWRLKVEAAKTWRVHSLNEIDYEDDLKDMGDYLPGATYRQGMIVRYTDGFRYLYINVTPGRGFTPPANPDHWSVYENPLDATAVRYSDGTPVENLQPAQAGADVTGDNVAASINDQGSLATEDQADFATQVAGAEKPEDNADVTSAITGPAEIVINADYTGAISTSLPRTQNYQLLKNGTDITATAVWAVNVISGVIDATIGAADGVLSLDLSSGSLSSSTIRLTATIGTTVRSLDVKVTKDVADAPTTGGGGAGAGGSASSSMNGNFSSTTQVPVFAELDINVGSSGQALLSADYSFNSTGALSLFFQWYRWNGTAFVALGTEVHSDTGYVTGGDPGDGSCGFTATGLTANSAQRFQLYGRCSNTHTAYCSGRESAVGS